MNLELINGEKTISIKEKNVQEVVNIKDINEGNKDFQLNVVIEGESSSIKINIILESKNKDKKKIDVSFLLKGKNQKGEIIVKGIANDKSQIECNASGVIAKKSINCTAHIHEKLYLFSESSRIKAIPQLKVETENLNSASHSASVSSIPEEIYFFLSSKGLNEKESYEVLRAGILNLDI